MSEFARIFVDRGARVAYNLDGGGSSAMVFNGSLVNNPLGKGQERGTAGAGVEHGKVAAGLASHEEGLEGALEVARRIKPDVIVLDFGIIG